MSTRREKLALRLNHGVLGDGLLALHSPDRFGDPRGRRGRGHLSGVMLGKTDSPNLLAMWSGVNIRAERMLIMPGALILLVAGTILVHEEGRSYSEAWIAAAYALWVVAVFLGAVVLGRHAHQINHLAGEEAAADIQTSTTALAVARSPKGPAVA